MNRQSSGQVLAFAWRGTCLLAAFVLGACGGGPTAGVGWKQATPPEMAGVTLSDVTASGAGFVAVGTGLGTSNAQIGAAFTSPDGTTWVAAATEPFKDATLAAVATVHAGLLALGAGHCSLECGGFQSWLSTDGTTWSGPVEPTPPGDVARGIGVVEKGSTIVAVATELLDPSTNKNRGRVYLSTDATAWMDPLTADGLAQDLPAGIATDGTSLVAVGITVNADGTHNGGAWLSTDGHAWSAATNDGSFRGAQLMAVVHGSGGYVAVGSIGVDGAVWSSSDGATWARVDGGGFVGSALVDIAANATGYIAVGHGANGGAAWTSTDGITWRTAGSIQGSEGTKFVAVAIGSTASMIIGGVGGSSSGMVWLGPLP